MSEGKPWVGVQMSQEEHDKLAEMARRTGRTKSAVIRLLIAQAYVEGYEIRFSAPSDKMVTQRDQPVG